MSDTAASLDDVMLFGGREFAFGDVRGLLGRVLGGVATGVAAAAAVGASAAVVTVAGLWLAGPTLSAPPHSQARQSGGPARLALADPAAFPKTGFEARWAFSTAAFPVAETLASLPAGSAMTQARTTISAPEMIPLPDVKVEHEVAAKPATVPDTRSPVALARVEATPLPRPNPVRLAIAQTSPAKTAPQIAAVTSVPSVEKRDVPPEPRIVAPALPGPPGRTALYDITGQVVYMPNGERLEAHSGFGHRRDNPRYIKVKNLGPTPPNVYKLTLRERLFHGVRAVRMTPVDESRMFGRDGMLAHSYLLGESGQSNGCVSFKDYDRFLQAFLNGEVDRIVVVRNLDEAPRQLASLARAGGQDANRYAANEVTGSTW